MEKKEGLPEHGVRLHDVVSKKAVVLSAPPQGQFKQLPTMLMFKPRLTILLPMR
jgi:hypothetical protein